MLKHYNLLHIKTIFCLRIIFLYFQAAEWGAVYVFVACPSRSNYKNDHYHRLPLLLYNVALEHVFHDRLKQCNAMQRLSFVWLEKF